jgi:hypothetical protein
VPSELGFGRSVFAATPSLLLSYAVWKHLNQRAF